MPQQHRFTPKAVLALTASLATMILLGCSGAATGVSAASRQAFVTGNWQFSSAAVSAVRLANLSGELAGTSTAVTGILHAQAAGSCVAADTAFEVSGSADSSGKLTLSGPVAGGTLRVTGTLASDGKSLSDATYNVTGGSCAFTRPAGATGQAYAPLSGNFSGSFVDGDGIVATITATLNQTPEADGNGNYALTGTAGLPNNPCFSTSALTVTDTVVTGGTFTFSFTDPGTGAAVTATGTFVDPNTLNVTHWTLNHCGTDSGSGTMTLQ